MGSNVVWGGFTVAIEVGSEIVIEELALHPLIESEAIQVYVPAGKPLTEDVVPTTVPEVSVQT